MKALSPYDLNPSYDQQKVDELIEKFNKKLKEEPSISNTYHHIVISGEHPRIILDRVKEEYEKAGWSEVECKTSSENGERSGLTGLQLWK